MSDWPQQTLFAPPVISSMGIWTSVGDRLDTWTGGSSPASAVWPSANRAIYVPFFLPAPYELKILWWGNGATASGNVDVGVYNHGGALIVSARADNGGVDIAQAGTSVVQSRVLTTTRILPPGSYYMARAQSNTTGTARRQAPALPAREFMGLGQQDTAYPLPDSITFATNAGYLPLFGISSAKVI